MAFVRNHFITKNGKTFGPYHSLVESFRDKGRVRQRYIRYLGDKPAMIKTPLLDPMRPVPIDSPPENTAFEQWRAQRKLDGEFDWLFATKDNQLFLNRRGTVQTERYPEFRNLYKKINFRNYLILAGEVVALKDHKDSFSDLSSRTHLKDKEIIYVKSKKDPLTYVAFDIIFKDSKPLINLPYEERKKILDEVIPDNLKRIKEIKDYPNKKMVVKLAKRQDWEGIVYKRIGSRYKFGRSPDARKMKLKKDADVAIIGYTKGSGKRAETFGSVLMGVYDESKPHGVRYTGKVSAGFREKQNKKRGRKSFLVLKEIFDEIKGYKTSKLYEGVPKKAILLEPHFLAKVSYLRKGSKGSLREPVIKGRRKDITFKQTHL